MTPEDAYVTLPTSIRLHYLDWDGRGAPIVLLHGLASSCRIWDFAAPILAEHFRVFALDQRGHGLSDRAPSHTFDDTTGDLLAFIESLGLERPVVAGHSWGASVALEFAARHPERLRGIALVDGGFLDRARGAMGWEQAEAMMRPPQVDGTPLETFVSFAKRWPEIGPLWSDQLQEMLLSIFEVRDGKIYRRLPIPEHMAIARTIWEQDPSRLWPEVRCPALLIPAFQPEDSPQRRSWTEAKKRGLESAQQLGKDVRVLPMYDTIHDIPIQRPKELAKAIIDFAAGIS